jgi:hypothetical protein
MKGFPKAAGGHLARFPKSLCKQINKNLCKLSTSAAHGKPLVATSGFWKPCHDCTSGWQENEQELVNFFIEAVSKSVFKYVKNYDIKNLKTGSGP